MSYQFLVPLSQQTIGSKILSGGYLSTDMAGLSFSNIPYGAEGIGIVTLANANPALAARSTLYAFPDLTVTMGASDVALLAAFLTAANIPSDQLSSSMTFGAALQIIAQIFLAAQALYGLTGSAIFTNGVGLDDTISDSGVAAIATQQTIGPGNMKGGGSLGGGGGQQQTQSGPFDFSNVSAADLIGDTLDSVSQQFTAPVVF